MKRFFTWLLRPAPLSLIGVIVLALIIWFEAPLLAFDGKEPFASTSVRWFLIWLFFLLWAGWFGYQWLKGWLAARQLAASLAPKEATPPAGAAASGAVAATDVATLSQRMEQALAQLRKSGAGRGGQYLYQLPWYMFVGAPGAGKTTALVNSGLKFPLAERMGKVALGGVGGTRHCDWWFTDDAVLLDTAGRYTTQDSDAGMDQAAWQGFLQLLRKHRRRRPINGVIVAVSVTDLLQQGEAARAQQAQAIRARLQDLHTQLGMRFPVYVLVTKSDQLAGFTEFFDDLTHEERSQVWGTTFALKEGEGVDHALAALPAELQALEGQLHSRLLGRMQHERDLQRRALIYSFPQQFAALGDMLVPFMADAFQSNRYDQAAMLRGVYFTSGTQEGNPIDRVMGALASAFGLERQVLTMHASGGRSYFLTRLLRDVIFAEAEVAGVNLRLERQRRRLQWAATIAIGVLAVLLVAALLISYARNSRLVTEAESKTAALTELARQAGAASSLVQALPLLDAVRDLPAGYGEREQDVPWLMTLGLYQGDKLGAGAQALYQRTLRAVILPRIQGGMEEQLRRGNANNPEYLLELLRVYLMLGDARHFKAETVAGWTELDWQRRLAGATPAQREALGQHLLAMLSEYSKADVPVQLTPQLITDTRLALAQMPLQDRLYNRIKLAMARSPLPEFSITSAGGRDALQVFARRSGEAPTRGVPGMFSVAGYAKFRELSAAAMANLNEDSWVLDRQEAASTGTAAAQVREAMLQRYYADYIAAWDRWLADLAIAPFSALEQGGRISAILSGTDSPLRQLLVAAARETTLEGTAKAGAPSLVAQLKDKGSAARKKFEEAMGGAAPVESTQAATPGNPVDVHFDALHRQVAGAPAPIDATLAQLKEVAAFLNAAAAAKRAGSPPPPAMAMAALKIEGDSKPAPLGQLLKNIESAGAGLTLGGERERLNALWTARAGPFCRQAIAGRYPMVRGAAQEVAQDDFGRFFGPGGMVDEFVQQNLMTYVDMGGRQWRWKPNADQATLGIPQGALDMFQRAAQIRDAYFGNGGRQASMRFDLKLLASDPAWSQVVLEIDGQPVPFGNPATISAAAIQLPSGRGAGQVRLETTPPSRPLRTEGAWAWLRMVDLGVLEPSAQGERYKLSFDLNGHKLVYSMTASSVLNPFRREMVEQFRCQERL